MSIVREMRTDMLRIGVNINQSSKRINSTTDYYDLQREVNHMASNLSNMEARLDSLMTLVMTGDLTTQQPTNALNGSPD